MHKSLHMSKHRTVKNINNQQYDAEHRFFHQNIVMLRNFECDGGNST